MMDARDTEANSRLGHLVGEVRTAYELHSYHGDHWLMVKAAADLRELQPAAVMLVERKEVDGIRLVRRIDYVEHDFSSMSVLVKRLREGIQETDPLQRANPGRDAGWCETAKDLCGDAPRQVIRGVLARYLDEKRLTALEVLHHEGLARELNNAGTTVQGALQRISSQQVRGTRQTAVDRMKELMALVDQAFDDLVARTKNQPIPTLTAARLDAVAAEFAKSGDPAPWMYRALAAHLKGAKTYLEKLDRLFSLVDGNVSLPVLRLIDSLAAEILASPLAMKELVGGDSRTETSRLDLVINLIDLLAGRGGDNAGTMPGLSTMGLFLSAGALPRSMAEVRHGILRHLHARLPMGRDEEVVTEFKAVQQIMAHLRTAAPGLARDQEIIEALETRAERAVQPDSMGACMSAARSTVSKIERVLGLVEAAPSAPTRAKLAPYLRTLIVPDDVIREAGGQRFLAIPVLSKIARRIQATSLAAASKAELLDIIDVAIFDILREILTNSAVAYLDRVLTIIKQCAHLPEGKARMLAIDTVTQALRRPEFMETYLRRFPDVVERQDAFERLHAAIRDGGFVQAQSSAA